MRGDDVLKLRITWLLEKAKKVNRNTPRPEGGKPGGSRDIGKKAM
jgi:hypothetical protein